MANTQQSAKRARQNEVRRLRKQSFRSRSRTMIKKARMAAGGGDKEAFASAYTAMQSVLDRAASKKVLHRNTVSRIKSRLIRLAISANSVSI